MQICIVCNTTPRGFWPFSGPRHVIEKTHNQSISDNSRLQIKTIIDPFQWKWSWGRSGYVPLNSRLNWNALKIFMPHDHDDAITDNYHCLLVHVNDTVTRKAWVSRDCWFQTRRQEKMKSWLIFFKYPTIKTGN